MSRRQMGGCLHGTCDQPKDPRSRSYCAEHRRERLVKTAKAVLSGFQKDFDEAFVVGYLSERAQISSDEAQEVLDEIMAEEE